MVKTMKKEVVEKQQLYKLTIKKTHNGWLRKWKSTEEHTGFCQALEEYQKDTLRQCRENGVEVSSEIHEAS